MTLIDQHGRRVRKLRLSLTDKCNLRCHYCMPLDATSKSEMSFLTPEEYHEVVSDLCELGLEEIRLTGGEPLMRKSFTDIIRLLARLPLRKIGLTTNGIFLDKHLEALKSCRVHHLNISLDSLNGKTFQKITYGNHLARILANIDLARASGFHIKVNVVAMKGINDSELFDFIDFSQRTGLEVRFLELMRIGEACGKQNEQYIPSRELIAKIKTKFSLKEVLSDKDSTSFNFLLDNGAQIGFIASESNAFCGQCSRWRLSADGILRACLFKDDGLSVKGKSQQERHEIYQQLLGMKPFLRPAEVTHLMHTIGG